MWYVIICLLSVLYLSINLVLPSLMDNFMGTYVVRPLLWISLAVVVFLIARREGLNIWKFDKLRKWRIGEKPLHLALLIGGFQIALLIFVGIFAGFGESPYSFTPVSILINIVFVASLLLGTELSRAYLIRKGAGSRKYTTLAFAFIALLFMLMQISTTQFGVLNFVDRPAALEFIAKMLITGFASSLLACYLAYLGGATASMGYMGVLLAFEWFSPVLPNPHWTALALVGTIAPAVGFAILQNSADSNKKRLPRIKRNKSQVGWTAVAIFSVIMVFFSFGFLGVNPSVIYSGSMQPALNVGDIALVTTVDSDAIQSGDVVQFYENNMTVIHRVVKIDGEGNERMFITKGDANQDTDFKPISPNQIVGKSVFTIPKIGWIQIYVKGLFSGAFR